MKEFRFNPATRDDGHDDGLDSSPGDGGDRTVHSAPGDEGDRTVLASATNSVTRTAPGTSVWNVDGELVQQAAISVR